MAIQGAEQQRHNQANLARLVKRLEGSATAKEWAQDGHQAQLRSKAKQTLQAVKYARRLLETVQSQDSQTSPQILKRYKEFGDTLNRLDAFFTGVNERFTIVPKRPSPILPSLPLPSTSALSAVSPDAASATVVLPLQSPADELLPAGRPSLPSLPTGDLLLSPSDLASTTPSHQLYSAASASSPRQESLIPSVPAASLATPSSSATPTSSTSVTTATPAFLQNSQAIQNELSDQLALMAAQLKRNAIHFSESLAKDAAVVEATGEKIEGNYGVMQKERVRLRDARGKTWGTTWIVVLSLIVVAVSFVFMTVVIRMT